MFPGDTEAGYGAAEDVARRLLLVQSLSTAIDSWAIDYQQAIPDEARATFATCRALLATQIVELIDSLAIYDGDIEDALVRLDSQ